MSLKQEINFPACMYFFGGGVLWKTGFRFKLCNNYRQFVLGTKWYFRVY